MGHHFSGPNVEFPHRDAAPHNVLLSPVALALVQAAQGMAGHPV